MRVEFAAISTAQLFVAESVCRQPVDDKLYFRPSRCADTAKATRHRVEKCAFVCSRPWKG